MNESQRIHIESFLIKRLSPTKMWTTCSIWLYHIIDTGEILRNFKKGLVKGSNLIIKKLSLVRISQLRNEHLFYSGKLLQIMNIFFMNCWDFFFQNTIIIKGSICKRNSTKSGLKFNKIVAKKGIIFFSVFLEKFKKRLRNGH